MRDGSSIQDGRCCMIDGPHAMARRSLHRIFTAEGGLGRSGHVDAIVALAPLDLQVAAWQRDLARPLRLTREHGGHARDFHQPDHQEAHVLPEQQQVLDQRDCQKQRDRPDQREDRTK